MSFLIRVLLLCSLVVSLVVSLFVFLCGSSCLCFLGGSFGICVLSPKQPLWAERMSCKQAVCDGRTIVTRPPRGNGEERAWPRCRLVQNEKTGEIEPWH